MLIVKDTPAPLYKPLSLLAQGKVFQRQGLNDIYLLIKDADGNIKDTPSLMKACANLTKNTLALLPNNTDIFEVEAKIVVRL